MTQKFWRRRFEQAMGAEIERMRPFLKGDEDFERIWGAAVGHAMDHVTGSPDGPALAKLIGVANFDQYLETWRDRAGSRWPIQSAPQAERLQAAVTQSIDEFRTALTELNQTTDPERREYLIGLCYFLMPKQAGLSPVLDALVLEFLRRYDERFQSKE